MTKRLSPERIAEILRYIAPHNDERGCMRDELDPRQRGIAGHVP